MNATPLPARIGNILVTAPLWRKAPESDLREIMRLLGQASFHFADDSTREWSQGRQYVASAAEIANRHQLGAVALRVLHRHEEPLVSENDWLDAVLNGARATQKVAAE